VLQRGRKGSKNLVPFAVNAELPRLKPPDSLTSSERELFSELIEAVAPDHFRRGDLPLLISFIQATLVVRSTANKADQIASWEKATKLQLGLARALRLTPSSRLTAKSMGRQAQPSLRHPWDD
jgi:hypothetical protein